VEPRHGGESSSAIRMGLPAVLNALRAVNRLDASMASSAVGTGSAARPRRALALRDRRLWPARSSSRAAAPRPLAHGQQRAFDGVGLALRTRGVPSVHKAFQRLRSAWGYPPRNRGQMAAGQVAIAHQPTEQHRFAKNRGLPLREQTVCGAMKKRTADLGPAPVFPAPSSLTSH